MRAYSSMPTSEFVNQLRDIAIRANAKPLVIAHLDMMLDQDPAETEKEREEALITEYDNGLTNGRATQFDIDRTALYDVLVSRRGKPQHGLTLEQVETILAAVDSVKPQ